MGEVKILPFEQKSTKITLGQLESACIGLQDIRKNRILVNNVIAIDNMLNYFNIKMKSYFEEKKKIFQKHETVKGTLKVDPVTQAFIKELTELQQVEVEIEEQIKPKFTKEDRDELKILGDSYQNTKDFVDWS